MPYSEKQRIAARIAEHAPERLHERNSNMLSMEREELHEMATGPLKMKKPRRSGNLLRPR
jgi:hypothetical protein